MTGDLIGLTVLVVLGAVVFGLLRYLSRPVVRTEEQHRRSADESTSMMAAGVEALNGAINPSASRALETKRELRRGTFDRKREGAKGIGDDREEQE
ncbi:MAG: hypothetical protein R2684_06310 [Pyrinomonadaceae bacterium]